MIKLIAVTALSFVASFGALDAAYAKKPSHQEWFDSLKAKGDISDVGDAFIPNEAVGNPKAECVAAGGLPKNQIESDGSIGIRCVPAYLLEQ